MDPRIPDEMEAFPLQLPKDIAVSRVEWLVDGAVVGTTGNDVYRYLWQLTRGGHIAQARVWGKDGAEPRIAETVEFVVK
jgi:penicillin-binding protein 1C